MATIPLPCREGICSAYGWSSKQRRQFLQMDDTAEDAGRRATAIVFSGCVRRSTGVNDSEIQEAPPFVRRGPIFAIMDRASHLLLRLQRSNN